MNSVVGLSPFDALCRIIEAPQERMRNVAAASSAELFGAGQAVLLLVDTSGQNLFVAAATPNPPPADLTERRFDTSDKDQSPLARAARSAKPVIINQSIEAMGLDLPALGLPWPGAGRDVAMCALRAQPDQPLIGILMLSGHRLSDALLKEPSAQKYLQTLARLLFHDRTRGTAATQISDLAQRLRRTEWRNSISRSRALEEPISGLFPGTGTSMKGLRTMLCDQARSCRPLLLSGPRGSWKESVARALHAASRHSSGRFVYVDCALFKGETQLTELLGARRGALPGRASARKGYLREASEGTLYFDNVEMLSAEAQNPIHRVLESNLYRTIGAEADSQFKGRIIAATHLSPGEFNAKHEAGFDPRLIGKLCSNCVTLPKMADCSDDFPQIVTVYLHQISADMGISEVLAVSDEAVELLQATPMPGQFQQLRDTLSMAVSALETDETVILPSHLARAHDQADAPRFATSQQDISDQKFDLNKELKTYEANLIHRILAFEGGNRARAAKRLRIPKRTLADKCKKYGL